MYGGRGAPTRWFLALSKRLRAHGFARMKTDVCMYSKLDSHGELSGTLVAHVGDLLFFGTPQSRTEAARAIQTFRTGDVETLTTKSPITFTGLTIEMDSPDSILLSQQTCANDLPLMTISEYVRGPRIANDAGLKTIFKQGLGALIWLHQTRPDIGFAITSIATRIAEACESPEKAMQLMNLYNKIVKFAQNHQRGIRYSSFPLAKTDSRIQPSSLLNWKLFVFADAGFGTLVRNHIVESQVVVLGDVISRDGTIERRGLLLDHRCAKIHRVCWPTVAAEAHAAVTAVDVALWPQVLLTEIFTRKFDYKRLTPPKVFPLLNPFRESPSDSEVRKEALSRKIHALKASSHSANPMLPDQQFFIQSTCSCCKVSMTLSTLSANDLDSPERLVYDSIMMHQPAILFHPMILTDCCSLYGAILRLKPKTVDRCTRITLAFLRDALGIVAFSYVDATVNPGDVGAKRAGSLGVLDRFVKTGRTALSFMERKERMQEMS